MPITCNSCGKNDNRDTAKRCSGCGNPLQMPLPSQILLSDSPLEIGVILEDRYKIITQIKTGGMSALYKAQLIKLNSICALKELMPIYGTIQERADAIEWFKREAKILAKLDHANLPKVYDYFVTNGRCYLVMNFIEGEDLLSILAREGKPGLSENEVSEWAKQVLQVLSYLHNQNPPIVYRDIKPSNIMLHKDGRAMLIDFGIARIVRKDSSDSPKTAIGTSGYAPLEQYQGKPEPRSDIYALGATMHHLLTGREPAPLRLEPLKKILPTISVTISEVVMKALGDNPADRFSSAKSMLQALLNSEQTMTQAKKSIAEPDKQESDEEKQEAYKENSQKDDKPSGLDRKCSFISSSNWQSFYRELLFSNGLRGIHFSDLNNGWVVGDEGTVFHTDDGGETWSNQKSGVCRRLYGVHFVDQNIGWAIGDKGTILYTGNGGETWKIQKSGTSSGLYGLHFVDHNNGWVVGEKGTILHITNGEKSHTHWRDKLFPIKGEASNWKTQKSGTLSGFYGIHFIDYNNGWVVGDKGTILYTADGGETWNEHYMSKCLMGVCFINRNNGWAVGEFGTILHSADGGKTWNTQYVDTSSYLLAVHFIDLLNGWAVGGNLESGEIILHTADGGKTWLSQNSGILKPLIGVHFIDRNNGWAVSYNGVILRTSDEGKIWNIQNIYTADNMPAS